MDGAAYGTGINFDHPAEWHIFQLRAYLYQARDMYGSDRSGLSGELLVLLGSYACGCGLMTVSNRLNDIDIYHDRYKAK